MNTNLKKIGSLFALGLLAAGAHAAAFTTGNIVVSQYGDGVATLSSTVAAAVSVIEYTPGGSLVQTINIPSTGITQLTGAGGAGSEDFIVRSTNATILTFAGYDAPAATTAIATTAGINRVIGQLDVNGNYTRYSGGATPFSGSNIRSAVSDGVNYWMAGTSSGANGGVWYSAGGAAWSKIISAGGNLRVARIFNGNLYYSTGSGTVGIYAFTGIPTAAATATNLIVDGGTSPSPYDFAISPSGTVLYMADDRTFANAGSGIQKWIYSGGSWSLAYTFASGAGLTAGCRTLAVDFSGANPVIYATTADTATKLITITDTGSSATATTLATAASNYAFRGVALAPTTAPTMITQPSDSLNNLINSTFSLTVGTTTGGQTLHYQWYSPDLNTPLVNGSYNGGTISGATSATLQFSSAALAQSGNYQVIITNLSGSITSRVAQVSVILQPVPPTIDTDISPAGSTNIIGDSLSFSVTAHGVPAVAYQWKWVPDTNTLVTNIIAGATSASLPLANLTTNQSGKYFVTITNSTSYYVTNSSKAVLKVNPSPTLTIAQLRAQVDGSYTPTNTTGYYTIQGTVTTWTNMTTSAAPQFFVQDSTAGIMVYWNNAGGSNCPPAGAVVKITGPLTTFQGNIEIKPDYFSPITGTNGVQIISTGGALPAPQPLPFDPNITGNPAMMKMLEGTYFVATNVTLAAGATFTSVNEALTNNAYHIKTAAMYGLSFTNDVGQTATIFINNYVGIVGQAKPPGPVTIYGVLQNFNGLYEFVPTRYADIISYISTTNVMTNARKGDAPTNSYSENVLRPGETLTATVSIADPEGGSVTLTPVTAGLPASATWTVLNNGALAHAVLKFTPTVADSASNYIAAVSVSSTSGNSFVTSEFVYVPDTNEQQMAISEFLANPTTNTAATGFFNPLSRATDTTNIISDDQYIEVANQSITDLGVGWTLDYGNRSKLLLDSAGIGAGLALAAGSSLVVYGGDGSASPTLGTPNTKVSTSPMGLRTGSSSGLLILRNGNGNIIDRVAYSGSDEPTNGSLSRFPTINDAFVPQAYVGFAPVTVGYQYDGAVWSTPSQIPTGVTNATVAVVNKQAVLHFPLTGSIQAYTLWSAGSLTDKFKIIFGQPLTGASASFTITNLPNLQFYYISTQTNNAPPPPAG